MGALRHKHLSCLSYRNPDLYQAHDFSPAVAQTPHRYRRAPSPSNLPSTFPYQTHEFKFHTVWQPEIVDDSSVHDETRISTQIDHAVSLVSLSCGREPWTHKLHLVESISWTRPITVCSPSPVHSLVSVLSRPTPIFNLNPMPIGTVSLPPATRSLTILLQISNDPKLPPFSNAECLSDVGFVNLSLPCHPARLPPPSSLASRRGGRASYHTSLHDPQPRSPSNVVCTVAMSVFGWCRCLMF
ncbi:hypothetical protein V8D89_000405 [Ganoderma adspersum]